METPTQKEWLVVFFVHEIATYKSIISDVIKEIQRKGCGANTAFYMLRDSVVAEDRVLYFRLSVFRLEKKRIGRGFKFQRLEDVKFDNSNRRCWEEGMQYIFQHEKAKRNMLITLSHGAAFGLNRDFGTVERPKPGNKPRFKHGLQESKHRIYIHSNPYFYFDQMEVDDLKNTLGKTLSAVEWNELSKGRIKKDFNERVCRNLEILWTADLARALEKLPNQPRIDVMVMANCFMQSFDTGYILRDRVEYLVAPQTGFPADGYDLVKLLDHIKDPALTPPDLVKRIVADYSEKQQQQEAQINFDFVVLTANKLTPYNDLLLMFLKVIKAVEAKMPALGKELTAIRDKILYVSFSSNNYNANELRMIDAVWWTQRLLEKFPDVIADPALIGMLKSTIDSIVIARHIGPHFADDGPFEQKFGINGISLFYPTKNDYLLLTDFAWCANFNSRVPSPFRRDSDWDMFLTKYYALPG